jgi:hypothetical protein
MLQKPNIAILNKRVLDPHFGPHYEPPFWTPILDPYFGPPFWTPIMDRLLNFNGPLAKFWGPLWYKYTI